MLIILLNCLIEVVVVVVEKNYHFDKTLLSHKFSKVKIYERRRNLMQLFFYFALKITSHLS